MNQVLSDSTLKKAESDDVIDGGGGPGPWLAAAGGAACVLRGWDWGAKEFAGPDGEGHLGYPKELGFYCKLSREVIGDV